MNRKPPPSRQFPLVSSAQVVYDEREKRIRELARQAITENNLTVDLVARLARIRFPEQLSRALAGDGTHLPTRVYAVLLDPMVDEKGVFAAGLAELAHGHFQREPDLSDAEFRRRVEQYARQDKVGQLVLERALDREP